MYTDIILVSIGYAAALSLCRWILGIRAPLVKTKLLLVKFELGPL
jgi:hypothetical protein